MIVNWVKEDEELLEPYEWQEGDDIEIISKLNLYKVDNQTLYDFIYGCLHIQDQKLFQKVFIIGNGKYSLAIETDKKGKLIYRSVIDLNSRNKINKKINALKITNINYQKYDEAEYKEYGLTRKERLNKQYLEQIIDEIYYQNKNYFNQLCYKLQINDQKDINKYHHLKNKLQKGYNNFHKQLYQLLINKKK